MTVPFLKHPVPGVPISQRFLANRRFYPPFTLRNGKRWLGGHEGLDFAAPPGTPVRAAHEGVVTETTRLNALQRLNRRLQPPYGNNVRLETTVGDKRVTTIYGHLDSLAGWVKRGAIVHVGDVIGWSGNTGRVLSEPGYHLHFGVNFDDWPVDPESLIVGEV